MSAPNFSYLRHCVLVPSDDIECGNAPKHTDCFDNDRSYPSFLLDDYNGFSTIAIVLTYGYYADACLDIVDDNSLVSEFSCSDYHFSMLTRDELFNELYYYFKGNISKRMMLRSMKGLDRRSEDYQADLENAIDRLFKEVRERELNKAEKVIAEIKKAYGYRELTKCAQFSNGEAWYDYID